jgi:endonuclease/exonuclease/phosphatase family metal-dependent hydrolase
MTERVRAALPLAFVVLLGSQLIRVFFTMVAWYQRSEVGTVGAIPYALGPFLIAVIATVAVVPSRRTVRAATGLLIAARLIEQTSSSSPTDLWASFVGVACFVWLLASYAARPGFAAGLLGGIALDVTVKGAATSLDLSWLRGPEPLAIVTAFAVATLIAVWSDEPQQVSTRRPWLYVTLGPLLFLVWQVLANQGWVATQSGLPAELALAWIAGGSLVGVVAADRLSLQPATATTVGVIIALVAATADLGLAGFPIVVVVGWAAAGAFVASLRSEARPGRAASVWTAVGVLTFALIGLVYYTTLDLRLPLGQTQVMVAAGIFVAVAGLFVIGKNRPPRALPPATLGVLLIVPAVVFATARPPETTRDVPLRVMSYNIAQGINVAGQFDPEGIARVIEASGATVVALQEVSRSWMIAGSTDTAAWLAKRLGMEYAYGSAADGGNVILSRIPLRPGSLIVWELPKGDTLIQRSLMMVELALPQEPTVTVMNTHLQHLVTPGIPDEAKEADYAQIQIPQLEAVIDAWGKRPRTVLAGDFNLRPDWRQYRFVIHAGFVDGWDAGSGPGSTTEDGGVAYRIDYVFHTPDLVAVDAEVIQTGASLDHLPVVVTFQP